MNLSIYLKTKKKTKWLCKKTVVHSSLIEELIDSRKNKFTDFMEAQKEAGQTLLNEIDSQISIQKEAYRKTGSLLEKLFFSHYQYETIDDNYINAPDRNGDYHIIRYEVGCAPKYTYTNNTTACPPNICICINIFCRRDC